MASGAVCFCHLVTNQTCNLFCINSSSDLTYPVFNSRIAWSDVYKISGPIVPLAVGIVSLSASRKCLTVLVIQNTLSCFTYALPVYQLFYILAVCIVVLCTKPYYLILLMRWPICINAHQWKWYMKWTRPTVLDGGFNFLPSQPAASVLLI